MRLLKIGDKNPDVQKVQQKLGLTPDGHFGPLTEKHVIRFQLSNSRWYSWFRNLVIDAIIWN